MTTPVRGVSIARMEYAGRIVVIAFAVALAYHFLKRPCNLRIDIRDASVEISGPALTGRKQVVSDFVRNDLASVRQARIDGYWDGHYLKLAFHGQLSPAEQQRVRNFLLTTL